MTTTSRAEQNYTSCGGMQTGEGGGGGGVNGKEMAGGERDRKVLVGRSRESCNRPWRREWQEAKERLPCGGLTGGDDLTWGGKAACFSTERRGFPCRSLY